MGILVKSVDISIGEVTVNLNKMDCIGVFMFLFFDCVLV